MQGFRRVFSLKGPYGHRMKQWLLDWRTILQQLSVTQTPLSTKVEHMVDDSGPKWRVAQFSCRLESSLTSSTVLRLQEVYLLQHCSALIHHLVTQVIIALSWKRSGQRQLKGLSSQYQYRRCEYKGNMEARD